MGKHVKSFKGLEDKITFGKYLGKKIKDILEIDPSYLIWAHNTIDWFKLEDEIYRDALDSVVDRKFNKTMHRFLNDSGMSPYPQFEDWDSDNDNGSWLS